jgi:methionyl-tRNA synthetase
MYNDMVEMMNGFAPFGRAGYGSGFLGMSLLVVLWTLPWKGVALWKAARRGSKPWFVTLLVLNTLAILEILYIFVFSKPAKPVPEQGKK